MGKIWDEWDVNQIYPQSFDFFSMSFIRASPEKLWPARSPMDILQNEFEFEMFEITEKSQSEAMEMAILLLIVVIFDHKSLQEVVGINQSCVVSGLSMVGVQKPQG